MNRCPITYGNSGSRVYSEKGLHKLSPALKELYPLEYTAKEQRAEAMERAVKMSVQGVQPKISAVLNIKDGRFEIVDKNGKFILKPQHHLFPELPQNEDLTMRMAEAAGIVVPFHGMVYSKDDTLTYFIRRFDRKGQRDKIHVEDFAQLAELSRDTKYNYSMEKLVKLLDVYCTFPMIEKARLFKLVLFNFLIGNEDMHLKNYSIIRIQGKIELSPAYDLLNSTIVLNSPSEEIALTIGGKKSGLDEKLLVNYFGRNVCGLTDKVIEKSIVAIQSALPIWFNLLDISFLSPKMKEKYHELLKKRLKVLGF